MKLMYKIKNTNKNKIETTSFKENLFKWITIIYKITFIILTFIGISIFAALNFQIHDI